METFRLRSIGGGGGCLPTCQTWAVALRPFCNLAAAQNNHREVVEAEEAALSGPGSD